MGDIGYQAMQADHGTGNVVPIVELRHSTPCGLGAAPHCAGPRDGEGSTGHRGCATWHPGS